MIRRVVPIYFLMLTAALQWRCASKDAPAVNTRPDPAAPTELVVKVEPLSATDWPVTIPVSGSLRSQSNIDIKSEVPGRLIAVYFEEGDTVRKDQLLAEIDPVNHRLAYDHSLAALGVAQANLERTRVALEHSRKEKERADNLLRTGGITEKDHQAALNSVKDAESQIKLGEAQCEQARATVAVTEKALRDCRIVAPADGQVRRRFLDKGSLLASGTTVYSLVDNARLELECLLPSYQLSEVQSGQRVLFTTPTWGERKFEGTVSAINPMVEAENRSIRLIAKIVNPGGALRSGMYARGEIQVRVERGALAIPRSAFLVDPETSDTGSVFVLQDGRAKQRSVRVGGFRQDQLWIQEGLTPGDQVILEIGPSLKDGTPVRKAQNQAAER